jgi:hypothetical protein
MWLLKGKTGMQKRRDEKKKKRVVLKRDNQDAQKVSNCNVHRARQVNINK